MANYDDRLKDYVDVKERIRLFYEKHPDGRLVTADLFMVQDADGVVRVWGKALAYRTADDPHPGTGTSYMTVPGTTPYTRGSEAENVETSCWGRAIGSLGIGIDKSIASAQEVANKQDDGKVPEKRPLKTVKPHDPDKSLIGKAELGKADSGVDWELHEDQLAFRLTQGNTGYKVVVVGTLAEQMAEHRDALMGERVKVWGTMESEAYARPNQPTVWYSVVHAVRLEGAGLSLPVITDTAGVDGELPVDSDGRPEAPSEPLPFDMAAVDAETLDPEQRLMVGGGMA